MTRRRRVFGVDRQDRAPAARRVAREAGGARHVAPTRSTRLFALMGDVTLDDIEQRVRRARPESWRWRRRPAPLLRVPRRRSACSTWVTIDLKIVRGLAYYTGIVFELFDAKGELRAICGGGRYDKLLQSLGGVDLPALGFGMGDVVLAELLRDAGCCRRSRRDRRCGSRPNRRHAAARRSARGDRAASHRRERRVRAARAGAHEAGQGGEVGRRRIRADAARPVRRSRRASRTAWSPTRRARRSGIACCADIGL